MRFGKIALVWGGLHQIDRECSEDLPVTPEWILIGRKNGSAVRLDRVRQLCHGGGRGATTDRLRGNPARARLSRGFFLTAWLPCALCSSRLGGLWLGHSSLLRALLSAGCAPLGLRQGFRPTPLPAAWRPNPRPLRAM